MKVQVKKTEIECEKEILDYLGSRGGFPCKIHLSGKPIKIGRSFKLIPFKNKYYRKGMSDILYIEKGRLFVFEVKTEDEYKKAIKNINRLTKAFSELPKYLHHLKEQSDFIKKVKEAGGDGGFVFSVNCVKKILEKT